MTDSARPTAASPQARLRALEAVLQQLADEDLTVDQHSMVRTTLSHCTNMMDELDAVEARSLDAHPQQEVNMSEIPRRICVDRFTPAEKTIYDAAQAVEDLPADVRLTDAVVLLQAARESVADYVDGSVLRRRVVSVGPALEASPRSRRAPRQSCKPLDLDPLLELPDMRKADSVLAEAKLLLPALRAKAREHGYALAVHGSLTRDIDLIAAPWTEQAVDALTLAEAIRLEAERVSQRTAFVINDDGAAPCNYQRRAPEPKPHGRLGWAIHIAGTGTYIDLSVLNAGTAWETVKVAELERKLAASYDETLKQSKLAQEQSKLAQEAEAEVARLRAVHPHQEPK